MTRDEAINLLDSRQANLANFLRSPNAVTVDSLVALGILKLDEPKPASERAFDIICRDVGGIHADIILDKLSVAGLRIVEK